MATKPLVSIIIATFNAESTLDDAINSVLKQTYSSIELIIVDGLSTDNTINIIKKYKSDSLHYVSEKDEGIYDALNKGVKLSNGEWLLFLGADDLIEPNGISDLMEISCGFDVVYGNVTDLYPDGKKIKTKAKDFKIVTFSPFGCHQSVLMRKDVIEKLNGFNVKYKIVADFDLIQRAYLAKYKFKKSDNFISLFSLSGISSLNYKTDIEWWEICKNNSSTLFPLGVLIYHLLRTTKDKLKSYYLILF
jgi:glycosyltransferase